MITAISIVLYALSVFLATVAGRLIEENNAGSAKFGLFLTAVLFVAAGGLQVAS